MLPFLMKEWRKVPDVSTLFLKVTLKWGGAARSFLFVSFLKVCSLVIILLTLSLQAHTSRSSLHFFSLFFLFVPFLTCSFLADIGQIVVAGNVVPFAVLMGDHNHAVFSTGEKVVRLIFTPVLVLLPTCKAQKPHRNHSLIQFEN